MVIGAVPLGLSVAAGDGEPVQRAVVGSGDDMVGRFAASGRRAIEDRNVGFPVAVVAVGFVAEEAAVDVNVFLHKDGARAADVKSMGIAYPPLVVDSLGDPNLATAVVVYGVDARLDGGEGALPRPAVFRARRVVLVDEPHCPVGAH